MAAKILRKVKRARTALHLLEKAVKPITIFLVTDFGYNSKGEVSNVIVRQREFVVFDGTYNEYPLQLQLNQMAIIYKP